jgi:5'-nucleotidase
MTILLTNDDGIEAPGLQALRDQISEVADCFVIAPSEQKSASAHAISLIHEVEVSKHYVHGSFFGYRVKGTPVDCVKLALCEMLPHPPDLIISGINQGPNTGVSIYYSGTVSAAREGTIADIPSIAASIASFEFSDFSFAARLLRDIAKMVIAEGLPQGVMLNINIPPRHEKEMKGIKVTRQAKSKFVEKYSRRGERDTTILYSLKGELLVTSSDGDSDEEAIREGYVSITPLKLDLTEPNVFVTVDEIVQRLSMRPHA